MLFFFKCCSFFKLKKYKTKNKSRQKINVLEHFVRCEMWKFFLEFCTLSCFLYDLIANNPRKLEVAESNLIMEGVFISFPSQCVGWGFPSFSFSFTF